MNRNRLVIIGIVALVLAGFVTFSLFRALKSHTTSAAPMTSVVVANNNLDVGTRLQQKDLGLIPMRASDVPPGAFTNIQAVVGRGVVVPIFKSDLVLMSKLAAENAGAGMPPLIPPGMRAVSVKVNDVISVAGFVTAGTRVDVVLTGNPTRDNDPGNITTTTILGNVQVLAAGQKLQRNEQGEPQQVTVITLLVTPEDAQKLVLASSEGRIQLALRNPMDSAQEKVPLLRAVTLYRLQPGGEPELKHAQARRSAPVAAASAPAPYIVEMIRGDNRSIAKF